MTYAWSPDDISWEGAQPALRTRKVQPFGGSRRAHGGALSRFKGTAAHADRVSAALAPDHPAVAEGRTLFPTRVFPSDQVGRILVSGHNSAKIGATVAKGPWRGFPIYTLTLEERATCPSTCGLWRECFGNAMPLARRHSHGPELIERLGRDLAQLGQEHPGGFAVRLHVLGVFWSLEYLQAWLGWMDDVPRLHVWGYTAHPYDSLIGKGIDAGNDVWPHRWSFRFSTEPTAAPDSYLATTIWRKPEEGPVPEGIVCPAQTGRTDACATCALCWSPEARDKRIVFVGHGMNRRSRAVRAA